MRRFRLERCRAFAVLTLALAAPVFAQTAPATSDAWKWRMTLFGWFPSVHTSTQHGLPDGGSISAEVDPSGYLSNLQFGFMGTLEARKGPWSVIGDALYLDMGDLKSTVRSISGPALAVSFGF